jgi:hypothetical protein
VLIGDWLNRDNQAEQSVRKNEQSVKELEEQLMATKYRGLKVRINLCLSLSYEKAPRLLVPVCFFSSPGWMDKDVSDFVEFS